MYLRKAYLENVGPITRLAIDLPFNANGTPKPLCLVGTNGIGKTVFMAHIADALMEFSVQAFRDSLPTVSLSHNYFKVAGGSTKRLGATYAIACLQFNDHEKIFQYVDKTGELAFSKINLISKLDISNTLDWGNEDTTKRTTQDKDYFADIFRRGAYCFFPASRSEYPHWLNTDEMKIAERWSLKRIFTNILNKPMVITSSAADNEAWLLDVVLDRHLYNQSAFWEAANKILRVIAGNDQYRWGIGPRQTGMRVAIISNGQVAIPSIRNLSAGQGVLVNLFLSILRYGDQAATTLDDIHGIVVIDEIDAHLHIDLQHRVLPQLISMLPKVQFVFSSHSPALLLGLERQFGPDGVCILEMPKSEPIHALNFSEYGEIAKVIQVQESVRNARHRVLLLVEGETDKTILETAWDKLGRDSRRFEIISGFDCFFIANTMRREQAFINNPDRVFVGLLNSPA